MSTRVRLLINECFFVAVFIAAGFLQWVDYMATTAEFKEANSCSPKGCITFFGAFYFMIVTVTCPLTSLFEFSAVIQFLLPNTAIFTLSCQTSMPPKKVKMTFCMVRSLDLNRGIWRYHTSFRLGPRCCNSGNCDRPNHSAGSSEQHFAAGIPAVSEVLVPSCFKSKSLSGGKVELLLS